mgnify:FL=1
MANVKLLFKLILERLSSQHKIKRLRESGKETSRETDTTRTTTPTTNRDTEYTHTPSAPTIHCSAYLYKRYTDCPCSYCTQFVTNIYDSNTTNY